MQRSVRIVSAILISMLAVASAHAENHWGNLRIRTTSPILARVMAEGVDRSPTFRRLIARLATTDVVAYLEIDGSLPTGLGGRTTFIAAAGGHRYMHVAICEHLTPSQRVVMVGHELQHVLEIADASDVVDTRSLARLYRTIGLQNSLCRGECYESAAAITVGHQVERDLQHRNGPWLEVSTNLFEFVTRSW